MGAPETGTGTELTGTWVTIDISVPDVLTDPLAVIQGLLEALLVVLNIVLAILQVVKAFLIGLLNPLIAIIEAIISEIEGLLQDIRQIGIYINGDYNLLQGPQFEDILGGYQAYERRMIGRLTDRTDPSRPNFSSRVGVLALFTYTSVDVTGIAALIRAVTKLMAFFGRSVPSRSYTTPTSLRVSYGINGQGLAAFGAMSRVVQQGDIPNQANLQWQMAPPPSGTNVRFPSLAPKGFLIEVSTVRDGLLVAYDVPISNQQPDTQNRIYGLAREFKTGLPFRLYGGTYMIDISSFAGIKWDKAPDKSRLYAYKDAGSTVPIPIESLVTTDSTPKFLLQRTFYVKSGFFNTVGPGQGFASVLNAEDMPYDATFELKSDGTVEAIPEANPATTVFVRVSAVTEDVLPFISTEDDKSGPLTAPIPFWFVSARTFTAQVQAMGSGFIQPWVAFNTGDKTDPSYPLTVTFPATTTKDYLDTVALALAVMVLSRSDVEAVGLDEGVFQEGKGGMATGLEDLARYIMPLLLGKNLHRYFSKTTPPATFRARLLRHCRAVANDFYAKSGPMGSLEQVVVNAGEVLNTFTWGETFTPTDYNTTKLAGQTLMESLQDVAPSYGLGLNPLAIGYYGDASEVQLERVPLTREPGFLDQQPGGANIMGRGSVDYAPVIYAKASGGPSVVFCRNVFFQVDGLYAAAATVLNIAAAPTILPANATGGWVAIRLFPQGLPPIEQALAQIIAVVRAIAEGLKGVVDIIIAYIEFLEARIREFQALILRIIGLLDMLLNFDIPSMSALIVTAEGTDGVLAELVQADNKPSDGTTAYGAGVVLMAGGLPSLLLDILTAFFPKQE